MKIGFIGCGKMGGAILKGVKDKVFSPEEIFVYELNPQVLQNLKNQNIKTTSTIVELASIVDVLLLAIKPQDFNSMLESIKDCVEGKLVISIAAGVKIEKIASVLGNIKIARAMPNTAAAVGEASSVITFNELLTEEDKKLCLDIFNAIGKVQEIKEDLMDEVIPIGGSFTAFEYYFYKGFLESSVARGVPYETAKKMLVQSIIGSAKMIESDDRGIDELINDVCSKGGTTLAGLKEFEDNNLLKIIDDCAVSCANRSRELGK